MESPRGIAVHPGIGRMFWTDWDRYGPKIESANMDGTERMVNITHILMFNHVLVISDISGLTPRRAKLSCSGLFPV